MKKRFLTATILLASCLTSCGQNNNNPHINRNGELSSLEEINEDNAYKIGSYEYIENLIEQKERFLFYFMQENCHACEDFKDVMLNYIKDTSAFVIKVNMTNQGEVAYKLYDKYGTLLNLEDTPRVYLIESKEKMTLIPQSRYSSSLMFNKAMQDYVYLTNVYTFSLQNSYKAFLENEENLLTIFVDYSNSNSINKYRSFIEEKIQNSDKKVALVQLDNENISSFKEEYALTDLSSPIGIIKSENKQFVFSSDNKESSDFLATYLN